MDGEVGAERGRRVTIRDVAARAGVSKGAVSLAFNDRPGVSPATRNRIFAAARELGWAPHLSARSLSSSFRAPNAAPRCGHSPEVVRIAAGRGGNRPREQPLWSGSRHPATG